MRQMLTEGLPDTIGPQILRYRSLSDPSHIRLSRVGRSGKDLCFRQCGLCIYPFGGAVEHRPEGEKHHDVEEREGERNAPNNEATTAGALESNSPQASAESG